MEDYRGRTGSSPSDDSRDKGEVPDQGLELLGEFVEEVEFLEWLC